MKVLVTGGAGFLGKNIVKELLDDSSPVKPALVKVFDINEYKGEQADRIEYVQGDITDSNALKDACKGIDVVIHSAAIVDWGTKTAEEIYAVNVGGTENVIKACHENNVGILMYTSSLDAVYSGKPLVNIDETIPYPEKHETSYCRSKYLSEVMVKEANSNDLKTCILRPSDIYGEEDPYHIGSLINMAKGGFYVRLGNGKSKCQHVYVGNMAFAHVLALNEILKGNRKLLGEAYFITDGPGQNFFKFFDQIILGMGFKIWPKNFWIPRKIAYAMGSISEAVAWLVRPIKNYTPKFSRFAVTYTCTDFTFTPDKAKKDFGCTPKYTEAEALERTIVFYRAVLGKAKNDQ